MKSLLRSTFGAAPTDDRDAHMDNFRLFEAAGLGFDVPEYSSIYEFVRDFVFAHRHVPDVSTIRSHFERSGQLTIVDKLEEVTSLRPRVRGDFEVYLKTKVEERRTRTVAQILQDAADIVSKGIEVKEGKEKRILQGPTDAVRFVMDKAHGILAPAAGTRLSGNVTQDGADFLKHYDLIRADPESGLGQMSGLRQMDEATGGAKKGELWVHSAFTGGLKSTFALNWVYTQSVWYGQSSLYFSLEMPYRQVRTILYAMHSGHEKFAGIHPPIEYEKIKKGETTPAEDDFLRRHVVPDFNSGEYGNIEIQVADPDKSDFGVQDMRMIGETMHAKSPFRMLVVDHAGLLASRHWVPSTSERTNEVIRDCKKLSMAFNRGEGIATVLLFQINRQGYLSAQKARAGGSYHVYNLTNLAYSNECEKSADLVSSTWIDPEFASQNRVLFQCLKTRDTKPFDPFLAEIHWPTRRILTCDDLPPAEAAKVGPAADGKVEI